MVLTDIEHERRVIGVSKVHVAGRCGLRCDHLRITCSVCTVTLLRSVGLCWQGGAAQIADKKVDSRWVDLEPEPEPDTRSRRAHPTSTVRVRVLYAMCVLCTQPDRVAAVPSAKSKLFLARLL